MVSTTGDYRRVHSGVHAWAKASWVSNYDHVYASNTTFLERSTSTTTPSHPIQHIKSRDDACSYVTVASGDSCASLASKCGITAAELTDYNPSSSLCSTLTPGEVICCSDGLKPDLSSQPPSDGLCYSYTVVSGDNCALLASKYYIIMDEIEDYDTQTWGWMGLNGMIRPSNWSDISSLNPCPLNVCCDTWGLCGITPEFCLVSELITGAPGTAVNNINGCISNCGTAILNNDTVVNNELKVGYFEAYGVNCLCLAMNVSQFPSAYPNVYYVFGEITSDFNVDISGSEGQFIVFAVLRLFKCVDFDWDYSDAPEIPGVPSGSSTDGLNYLSFLQTLRGLLLLNKTIFMAASALYWYLRGFPIANMSEVLDYNVYMTYDLYGQWDYNNSYVNPGCPTANYLRSHVNLTEAEYALAMISKAGVPAHKVADGITSYGRSFGMVEPSCTGPECLFTGPDSTASLGECTVAAGYISQAELERLSDNSWVAYITQDTKASRIDRYSSYGLGGVVEWASDLTNLVEGVEEAESNLKTTAAEEEFTAALSLSNYDISNFNTYNLSVLYTKLIGFDRCSADQRTQIYSGWQQSWKVMNYMYKVAKDGISFGEADAIDYLGPSLSNEKLQGNFKDIYLNLATIQPGWLPSWLDWKIAIRCDDPYYQCPCGSDSLTIAYAGQKDAKYQVAYINFCPKVWLHELLHIDWVAKADEYGSNVHVSDLKVGYRQTNRVMKWFGVYGPNYCKALARIGAVPSAYTIMNSDSLVLYALTKYVHNKLGAFPYRPLAPPPPQSVEIPMVSPKMLTVYPNGTGVEVPNTTLDDEAEWSPNEESVTTATATPTATWAIPIYAEENCAGDHYIVEGHNQDTTSNRCLLISDLRSTDTTSASCRWYSSGSDTYTSCDESSLTEPLSWQLSGTGAECTAFDNDSCNDNADQDAYTTSEGYHSYSERDLDKKT
ncbi:uncharacterized protein An12g05330 [Aspergillus niger]|uniref:chitinase n=2 Tax=Aspergillus niger TaxID=5061 RepID=A2QZL4_ASPNC|nr:uncharacterized protein An12g05330 [Aspergillus niger]CAK46246.1 unnamed protein product [Aspergillus niger]